jgi:glycosyltransferase involved in cell wall biosynthesis
MRLLFLTAQPPEPPHAGGTLRTNGLMRHVFAAGHEIHLLSFAEEDQLKINQSALKTFCARVETVPPPQRRLIHRLRDLLLTNLADMQRRCYSPQYAAKLAVMLDNHPFDLIQIESLEMATYLRVLKRKAPDTPVIYDSFNAEFDLQRSVYDTERGNLRRLPGALYSLIQWRRLIRFEREVCQSVAHTIAVSEADAESFRALVPDCSVSVVPNGINTQDYAQHDSSLDLGNCALVFTGSMDYRPNVDAAIWFAEQILPLIRERVPEAKFFVVGNNPHPRLDMLRERDDVEITGWVPDVNPFLHAATVYVVPMRMGSGTRLKVLQAMAAGKAVVSTRTGAQGLYGSDSDTLRLADTAAGFADAVSGLLQHPDQRHDLGAAGAEYVKANYDWSVIAPKLLRVYDEIMSDQTN